ncbi:hypothetical protein [Halocatena pleomorpha]|uniref:Lipoate--protein ligase n=1 Tax=Halocatena pleomorpha TaxID=1785090 RepID=A0A3P3RDF0_9EURY|nr:hypothetical protein [Halocatena pleomorpha]RRJ31522.1 hypothetical protein EIK79_07355 [Halocatena pleomorpha]
MEGTATHKAGKLVEVRVTYDDELEDVTIRGDFFLEPPDALEELEAAIEGLPTDSDHARIVSAIQRVDAQLIGFDAETLATALEEAVHQ